MIPVSTIIFSVYLAAVLQYLTSEILELAGEAAHLCRKKRISPRHLLMAARGDDESVFSFQFGCMRLIAGFRLRLLLEDVIFSEAGFLPLVSSCKYIYSLYFQSFISQYIRKAHLR